MLIHDPAQHYTKDLRRPQPTLQYQLAATTAGYLVFVIALNLILYILNIVVDNQIYFCCSSRLLISRLQIVSRLCHELAFRLAAG